MTGALGGRSCSTVSYKYVPILWLHTAYLIQRNHYNDAPLFASFIPSVLGMGPSVLFPALSSSVFRTLTLGGSRENWARRCFVTCELLTDQNGLLVGFLLLTGMGAAVSRPGSLVDFHRFIFDIFAL